MTQTLTSLCKACGDPCVTGKATAIGNYGTICAACLTLLKAGFDPSEGDRLHKRVDRATLVYADPMDIVREWRAKEAQARATIVTEACGCCGDRYDVRGLAPLEYDHTFIAASEAEDGPADRDDLLCKFCRERLEAAYGTEDENAVYHYLDIGLNRYNG